MQRFIPTCVGLMDHVLVPEDRRRFIPTCVGLICIRHTRSCPETVHPHVRGVNCHGCLAVGRDYGSSPRAWG